METIIQQIQKLVALKIHNDRNRPRLKCARFKQFFKPEIIDLLLKPF